jgi:hypothetical protein
MLPVEFQDSRFAIVENKIWMRLRTISERFAPQTLIRGSTGGGTCPRSVLWRSILRSASTIGVSTNIGLVAPAAPWKLPSLARKLSRWA